MQNINLLIVEDEAEMREVLKQTLVKIGVVNIGEAASGQEAIDMFADGNFNVVTLDIGLPDTDGLSVLSSLKKMNEDVFIVLVTADDSIESIQTAISSGANGYVVKPYSYEKILDVINNYLLTQKD